MNDSKELIAAHWPACKLELVERVGPQEAEAWADRLVLREIASGHATLTGIPNSFFKTRISDRFSSLLKDVLCDHFPQLGTVEGIRLALLVGNPREIPEGFRAPQPDSTVVHGPVTQASVQSPLKNGPTDYRYTFDHFISGEGNSIALRAAKEVADHPGTRFNPLIIVGGVGSGKTHLLQAIANQISLDSSIHHTDDQENHVAPICLSAEAFANTVLDGIRGKRMKAVRSQFRSASALLIDNLEFLLVSGKTQEELLHTFDVLFDGKRQLVFTADRFPAVMQGMNPTLRSRLESGLVVELGEMDFAMRLQLVHQWAKRDGAVIQESVAQLLAEKITGGPRQLEGALVRLSAYSSMEQQPIDEAFALRVAAPFFDSHSTVKDQRLSGEDILQTIKHEFGIAAKTIRSRDRTPRTARLRKLAIYFLRHRAGLSFPEIGAMLGNRVHSTIIHNFRAAEEDQKNDKHFQEMIRRMEQLLATQWKS